MKDKIIYIGLTEDPEVTPIKNSYCINKSGFSAKPVTFSVGTYTSYLDKSYVRQFRREEWERVERNAYRITSMVAIKNNLEEGERISLIWG
jgi:hypothetical protein